MAITKNSTDQELMDAFEAGNNAGKKPSLFDPDNIATFEETVEQEYEAYLYEETHTGATVYLRDVPMPEWMSSWLAEAPNDVIQRAREAERVAQRKIALGW